MRAKGPLWVPDTWVVTRSRTRSAARRVGASTRQASGVISPVATRSATIRAASVVLPVPGPPRTRSTADRSARTASWQGSVSHARGGAIGARTRVTTGPIPPSGTDSRRQ